jgi:23S rRNA (guanine745-N1)-methyltransferase
MKCVQRHSFDIAREGYINLIPGKAPTATQGDSAAMLQARRAFLRRGYYDPLLHEIKSAVSTHLPSRGRTPVVADIGCGEGYYLSGLMQDPSFSSIAAYGTDISKVAAGLAAKSLKQVQFVVADTNRLIPFETASIDVCLNIFAPRNALEFARIVRPDGVLIVVIPDEHHLESLRNRFHLLDIESGKIQKISGQLSAFELIHSRHVTTSIALDARGLQDLVNMTPSARHVDEEANRLLSQMQDFATEISFDILVFSRHD